MKIQADKISEAKARKAIALVDDVGVDLGAPKSVTVHSYGELVASLKKGLESAEKEELYSLRQVAAKIENKYFSI